MRPILLIAAACAALLAALPAEAGVTLQANACCVPQQVVVQAAPVVVQAAPVIVQPQILTVQAAPAVVTYQQGTRKLTLKEKWRSRRAHRKVLRETRVATVEAVVSPPVVQTLGIECEGAE